MSERFTKKEAEHVTKALDEMFTAMSKPKKMEYLGHFNDILLFIDAAKKHAP